MKTLPIAMVLGALTQSQSGFVLGCLVFVAVLLIVSMYKMWTRLTDLEEVVYASKKITQEAEQIIDKAKSDSKDRLS